MKWWFASQPKTRYSRPVRLAIHGSIASIECERVMTEDDAVFLREWWRLATKGPELEPTVTVHSGPPRPLRPKGPDYR